MKEKTSESTVVFKSNLQLVEGYIDRDKNFLASIHDPFALNIMREKNYDVITPQQKQEIKDASIHCSYAIEDDYPWGTVIDKNGVPKVVCKCTNIACINFLKCRPDFDESELDAAKENEIILEKIELFYTDNESEHESYEKKDHGDVDAAVALMSKINEDDDANIQDEAEGIDAVQPVEKGVNSNGNDTSEKEEQSKRVIATARGKLVSFSSFVDVEQSEIIEKDPESRIVVNAGPGTGKTWTLIEKIKYMLSVECVEPENILVLCFSRAAVEVIRNRLNEAADNGELPLNWHEVEVRTFDSFATYLLVWIKENKSDILTKGFALEFADYNRRIEEAVNIIKKISNLLEEYRHVIVDEVQDLVGIRAEMVLALLRTLPETCGFTILGDACQALYDYLAEDDKSIIDSQRFYNDIFTYFNDAYYYRLTRNYRQGDAFGCLLDPYRDAILHGNNKKRIEEANKLNEMIPMSSINLKDLSNDVVEKLRRMGTVGILTRTNGQALQISSWLHTAGLEHILQKPVGSQDLASWIAKVLMHTETDVIDKNEFVALFTNYYPNKLNDVDAYWDALTTTLIGTDIRHYEVEDLLRGVLNNARNPLLFEEPVDINTNITVSNIHRAKGREFDTVLVLDDILTDLTKDECDDLLEHKVCYVALTRPKNKIEKIHLKPQYIYVSNDEKRRCFKAGRNRRKQSFLSHIEVGDSTDINQQSIGINAQTQEYIYKMPVGTRLKLLKCHSENNQYVLYRIVPEDDEYTILGYTTSLFATCIEKAIQRIFNKRKKIDVKYYPNIFMDIYYDGLITCISSSSKEIPGAKKFGDMYIWYGISISGFAQMEKDRY